jgi:peptidoglycan/LPS O-acetylase OafA/YrhL
VLPPAGSIERASASHGHCYWLDWLRFGAAFVVLVGHVRRDQFADYAGLVPKDHVAIVAAVFAMTRVGFESVILFFVLSGFLVGGRSTRKAFDGSFSFLHYSVDRVSRIYLPLLPALILTAAIAHFLGGHVSGREFLGNLAGLQGVLVGVFGDNGPLWSLAYEMWFYALFGAVVVLMVGKHLTARSLAWVSVFAGLAVFTKLEAVYLFAWVLGALVYLIQPGLPRRWGLSTGIVLTLIGMACLQLSSKSASLNFSWLNAALPSRPASVLCLSLGFAFSVSALSGWEPRSPAFRRLEKMGTPLAAFSYTLYLTHYIILRLLDAYFPGEMKELTLASISTSFLKLLICMAAAWLMYFLFERNTGKVRRWMAGLFI